MYQPRRVLITGGSSGLGLSFAKAFATRGADLVLLARGEAGLAGARAQIAAQAPAARVETLAIDVANGRAVQTAAAQLARGGNIDLLINCAGILREGYLETLPENDFREMIDINLFGTVHSVHAFLPQLRATRGRIVNISSLSGVTGIFGYSGYCASKFAVQGYSEVLRLELRPQGIAVHVVCPGEFESPMLAALAQEGRTPENRAHATRLPAISVETVVRDTFRGIERGEYEIVPGRLARVAAFAVRHFPRITRMISDRRIGGVYVGPQEP
ncbi:MAG: SDR family NAD(P)-dependent oxidoreductase [Sinimarinibacterium sp.]|jgi:3-dehydrosphinganine reductase